MVEELVEDLEVGVEVVQEGEKEVGVVEELVEDLEVGEVVVPVEEMEGGVEVVQAEG